jgi:hypothetical protein
MKLTAHKRKFVEEKVIHYSNLLKVPAPKVFLTEVDYECWKASKRTYKGEKVGRTNCLGICHREEGFIVVLVKKSPSLERLDKTIRHEMIHYAKPSYNHSSKEFEDRMNKLKKGQVDSNGRFV